MTRALDVGDFVASAAKDWRWLGFGRVIAVREDGRRTIEWGAGVRTHESPDRLITKSEAQDQAEIDTIMAMSDAEIIATSEPDAAEKVQQSFERAKEEARRRRGEA